MRFRLRSASRRSRWFAVRRHTRVSPARNSIEQQPATHNWRVLAPREKRHSRESRTVAEGRMILNSLLCLAARTRKRAGFRAFTRWMLALRLRVVAVRYGICPHHPPWLLCPYARARSCRVQGFTRSMFSPLSRRLGVFAVRHGIFSVSPQRRRVSAFTKSILSLHLSVVAVRHGAVRHGSNRRNTVDLHQRISRNAACGRDRGPHRRFGAEPAHVGFVHRSVVLQVVQVHVHLQHLVHR